MNRCSLEALSRSFSIAENLHLNCIAHTAWCTAPEEVRKQLGWVLERWRITTVFPKQIGDKHNLQQYNNQISIWFFLYPSLFISYSVKFKPWYEAIYDINYYYKSYKMGLLFYIYNPRVIECYLASLWPNTGAAGGITWETWSKIKENRLHSTEGSLLDIHWPNRPITTPITCNCSGWLILEKTRSLILDCLALCSVIKGQERCNALRSLR